MRILVGMRMTRMWSRMVGRMRMATNAAAVDLSEVKLALVFTKRRQGRLMKIRINAYFFIKRPAGPGPISRSERMSSCR